MESQTMNEIVRRTRSPRCDGLGSALGLMLLASINLSGCANAAHTQSSFSHDELEKLCVDPHNKEYKEDCHVVTADVVALEQVYSYNRFGAFNPAGMVYALARDLVASDDDREPSDKKNKASNDQPLKLSGNTSADRSHYAGKVRLRDGKRARPIVLRVNEGSYLHIRFTNLLSPTTNSQEIFNEPLARTRPDEGDVKENLDAQRLIMPLDSEEPRTRHASIHVNGLDYVDGWCSNKRAGICADGANVGLNPSSLAAPGETLEYVFYAKHEGAFLLYSMAGPIGGEGDGGQLGLGLFGAVNVEPKKSTWFRSQVTQQELVAAQEQGAPTNPNGTPRIDYFAKYRSKVRYGSVAGDPILAMLKEDKSDKKNVVQELVYTDLNAIVQRWHEKGVEYPSCDTHEVGATCGDAFREFTSIFHDEITAVQAFPELEDESNTLNRVKDGMGINYGASSMGSAVLASRKGIGPAAQCAECKLEEFFLSSWANGDPAMLVEREVTTAQPGSSKAKIGKATKALYPDDPSNVHHSYLGDPVVFRNMHAGPKETHVFHLHAHQWVRNDGDDSSMYLDSQTISPGASFSYPIYYGGSGNRNFTPGDSIFHCHLYPHFAQGMWELWRTHDAFESGTELDKDGLPVAKARALPDGEIIAGTPIPAIVPLPGTGMPPMPTEDFKGYPFYIAGQPGHRPPQPPLDLALEDGEELNGGLPRHRILDGATVDGGAGFDRDSYAEPYAGRNDLYGQGRKIANQNAKRILGQNGDPWLLSFARKLTSAQIEILPLDGTPEEKRAMSFHEAPGRPLIRSPYNWEARSYDSFDSNGNRKPFLVNGKSPKPGAPFADPCPIGKSVRPYKVAYVQFDMTVNKAGWHDPQARIAVLQQDVGQTLSGERPPEPLFIRANSDECITFTGTNLTTSALNVDDFQVFSPTDIVGQHIHLVKFDVTSSDGSANGWNYEDGTYSPDEVRERIDANNIFQKSFGGSQILKPKAHRDFVEKDFPQAHCALRGADGLVKGQDKDGPWCGAQATMQRWWADPLLNSKGKDRTIRTVFTHDHFGPSSHQHHGLYAALVVEPKNSEWKIATTGKTFGGAVDGIQYIQRRDGGPTSYAALIETKDETGEAESKREFNLAFADFAIVYDETNKPVNGPEKTERPLPFFVAHPTAPRPESISAGDPGTQLINYRNEPIALRIGKRNDDGTFSLRLDVTDERDEAGKIEKKVKLDKKAKMENVFSSTIHKDTFPVNPASMKFSTDAEFAGLRTLGDPATPLLWGYEHDRVQIRLVQGAQEENHVFTAHGLKWLSQPGSLNSGYMNAQHIGISEHFEFDAKIEEWGSRIEQPVDHLYSSSATDNLWDGMWGILRVFPDPKGQTDASTPANSDASHNAETPLGNTAQTDAPTALAAEQLPKAAASHAKKPSKASLQERKRASKIRRDKLKRSPEFEAFLALDSEVGGPSEDDGDRLVSGTATKSRDRQEKKIKLATKALCRGVGPERERIYNVSAWLAQDVLPGGVLKYNERFGIGDPNAILFIEDPKASGDSNFDIETKRLALLREFKDGKRTPEPLILRARAGDCIHVRLTNHLPDVMPDWPFELAKHNANSEDENKKRWEGTWSYNMVPPIAEQFNFNQIASSNHVGLHPQLMFQNLYRDDAANVGNNKRSTVAPGKSESYTWFAGGNVQEPDGTISDDVRPIEFGVVALRDMADVIKHTSHGAIGALVIEPQCSHWEPGGKSQATKQVSHWEPVDGRCPSKPDQPASFQEFVLLYQDDLSLKHGMYRPPTEEELKRQPALSRAGSPGVPLPNLRNGDDSEDSGQKAFNYRTEPLWARLGAGGPATGPAAMMQYDFSKAFSSKLTVDGKCEFDGITDPKNSPAACDPETPLFSAKVGDEVRFRVVHPGGHPRNHAFTLFGHNWQSLPWTHNSTVMGSNPHSDVVGSTNGIGPARHVNIVTRAGGACGVPGDFMYRTQEGFMFGGGLWGIFRVTGEPKECPLPEQTQRAKSAAAHGVGNGK